MIRCVLYTADTTRRRDIENEELDTGKDRSFDQRNLNGTNELMERFFSLSDMYEQVGKDLYDRDNA